MVWHDVIATLLLWLIFLYLFVSHSIVFGKAIYLVAQEHPRAFIENWRFRLKPFGILVLVLLIWLVIFGRLSLRNRKGVIGEPVPRPLAIAIRRQVVRSRTTASHGRSLWTSWRSLA